MRTIPTFLDNAAAISWLAAVGYVLILVVAFAVYTWFVGLIVRRRHTHHAADVHEVPRAPQIRKVA